MRAELKKADFTSLRGKFKFGINHYPIQDFYLVKAAKRPTTNTRPKSSSAYSRTMSTITPRNA